jgi:taspase (threonine aspartase 1)
VQGAGKDLKAVVNKMDLNDIKGNGQKSTDKDPGAGGDIMSNNDKMGDDDIIMDTVGAICIDYAGNLATGVSSGGIAMKVKGRVGMAAVYGCGCWAGAKSNLSGISTACTFTGAGEQIVQSIAAHECCVLATQ